MTAQRAFALGAISLFVAVAASRSEAGPVYTYDALGRLISVRYDEACPGGSSSPCVITYSYDAAGNRTQVTTTVAGNAPPVAVADTTTIYENVVSATVNVRANDSDPESGALTVVGRTDGERGTTSIVSGSLVYTPSTKRNGSDFFYYTIADPAGLTATAPVTVTLANRNPIAVADTGDVDRNDDAKIFVLANDTDPGNDELRIASATNGSKGVVTVSEDRLSLTYRSNPGQSGSDSFTYVVRDADGGTATGSVSVAISAVNAAPSAQSDIVVARGLYTGTAIRPQTSDFDPRHNDTDPNGDPLSVVSVTNGAKGTVFFGPTYVRYRYNTYVSSDLQDVDSFTYTVSDGFGGTSTATVNVTIVVTTIN